MIATLEVLLWVTVAALVVVSVRRMGWWSMLWIQPLALIATLIYFAFDSRFAAESFVALFVLAGLAKGMARK